MSFQTFEHILAYPLFGAQFLNHDTFVVSGGGGEGRHGIPNEIDVFKITQNKKGAGVNENQMTTKEESTKDAEKEKDTDLPELLKKKQLELISQYKFEKNCTDAPMSLELYKNKIFVGCSDSKDLIAKSSKNESLKVLKISSDLQTIEMDSRQDIFKCKDPQSYIKKIHVYSSLQDTEEDPIVVCLNSDEQSKILINDYKTKDQFLIQESREIKDFATLQKEEGYYDVFYITKKEFKIYNILDKAVMTVSLSKIQRASSKEYQLLKIVTLTNNELLIIGAYPESKVIFTFVYDVANSYIIKFTSNFLRGIKSVNCAAFKPFKDNKNNGLLALGTSNLSVTLFNVSLVDFQIDKLFEFKKSHTFALTNVIISPNLEYVVSISAANSIHVIELPGDEQDLINLKNSNGYLYILLLLVVLLIAYLLSGNLK